MSDFQLLYWIMSPKKSKKHYLLFLLCVVLFQSCKEDVSINNFAGTYSLNTIGRLELAYKRNSAFEGNYNLDINWENNFLQIDEVAGAYEISGFYGNYTAYVKDNNGVKSLFLSPLSNPNTSIEHWTRLDGYDVKYSILLTGDWTFNDAGELTFMTRVDVDCYDREIDKKLPLAGYSGYCTNTARKQ